MLISILSSHTDQVNQSHFNKIKSPNEIIGKNLHRNICTVSPQLPQTPQPRPTNTVT